MAYLDLQSIQTTRIIGKWLGIVLYFRRYKYARNLQMEKSELRSENIEEFPLCPKSVNISQLWLLEKKIVSD